MHVFELHSCIPALMADTAPECLPEEQEEKYGLVDVIKKSVSLIKRDYNIDTVMHHHA